MNRTTMLCAVLFLNGCAVAHAAERTESAAGAIPLGAFTKDELAPVQKKFDELVTGGAKDIMFRISSNGGELTAGMDLLTHVRIAKREHGVHVKCVVEWKAFSMGFIFLQGACDERLLTHGAVLMAHGGLSSAEGNLDESKNTVNRVGALNDMIAELASSRMGITKASYLEHCGHNEWWFSGDQALASHAADGYTDADKLPPLYELEPVEDSLSALRRLLGG